MNKTILIVACLFTPITVWAQGDVFQMPDFNPIKPPISPTTTANTCIDLTNKSQHTITGDFVSDQYEKESEWGNTKVSNRYKFKVAKDETQTICPAGPYFAGPSIEFVIRRAFPVFRCKALLGRQLTVLSTIQADGAEKFSANCN